MFTVNGVSFCVFLEQFFKKNSFRKRKECSGVSHDTQMRCIRSASWWFIRKLKNKIPKKPEREEICSNKYSLIREERIPAELRSYCIQRIELGKIVGKLIIYYLHHPNLVFSLFTQLKLRKKYFFGYDPTKTGHIRPVTY
jgi:hypothetical protein